MWGMEYEDEIMNAHEVSDVERTQDNPKHPLARAEDDEAEQEWNVPKKGRWEVAVGVHHRHFSVEVHMLPLHVAQAKKEPVLAFSWNVEMKVNIAVCPSTG